MCGVECIYLPSKILRPAPMFWPAWVAPTNCDKTKRKITIRFGNWGITQGQYFHLCKPMLTFVLTSLETNHCLASFHLFIGKFTFVQIGWFWSQFWSSPAWVLPHGTAKGKECVCHVCNIFLFKKIDCLKYVNVGHTVLFQCFLEVLDVFHQFECGTAFVDFCNWAWLNFVDQFAADNAILQGIFIWLSSWEFPCENSFNPFLGWNGKFD